MRMELLLLSCLLLVPMCSCSSAEEVKTASPKKFTRVFCWGSPTDEETARKYSEIGVTDITVSNKEQLALARKYGMKPYCGTFGPRGKHGQVMSPEEEKHFAYINGHDLKKMDKAERNKTVDKRRIEMKHRYGGEPAAELDVLNSERISCFLSDTDYKRSKAMIDRICFRVDGVEGIFFDYIGYTNFKGCYCKDCQKAYKEYLAEKGLKDTQANKDTFYREKLVKYYNDMVDYVKSKHPDFKVVAHIYPVFLPEPLYGNRTKVDFCGQTVAWYFPWDQEKIAKYTKVTVNDQNRYHKGVQGIPFVGLNTTGNGSFWAKDPATIEKELQTILAAGGDTLMVCGGWEMIKPGYYEVFKKYCGKEEKAKD